MTYLVVLHLLLYNFQSSYFYFSFLNSNSALVESRSTLALVLNTYDAEAINIMINVG
jgi:hypothetical protein